jgi:molecular chaperone DnaK (HSP70)
MMGRKYGDPSCQELLHHWPFQKCILKASDGTIQIKIDEEVFTPVELQTRFLQYLSGIANDVLKQQIKDVVITIPANFNNFQRRDTLKAATDAGFKVLRLLHEPTAAAVLFTHHPEGAGDIPALVGIDIGDRTFDVSLLRKSESKVSVLGIDGDPTLGGLDFDLVLAKYVNQQAVDDYEKNLLRNAKFRAKLLLQCEKAKIALSGGSVAAIELDQIIGEDEDVEPITVTVEDFTQAADELVIRCQLPITRLLESHKIAPTECRFLMVGGSSPIQFLKDYFVNYFQHRDEVLNDVRGAKSDGNNLQRKQWTFVMDGADACQQRNRLGVLFSQCRHAAECREALSREAVSGKGHTVSRGSALQCETTESRSHPPNLRLARWLDCRFVSHCLDDRQRMVLVR